MPKIAASFSSWSMSTLWKSTLSAYCFANCSTTGDIILQSLPKWIYVLGVLEIFFYLLEKFLLHTAKCTLRSVKCMLRSVQCTLHSVQRRISYCFFDNCIKTKIISDTNCHTCGVTLRQKLKKATSNSKNARK